MTAIGEFAARYVACGTSRTRQRGTPPSPDCGAQTREPYTAADEYIGLDAITRRVTAAHQKFVAGQGYAFSAEGVKLPRADSRPGISAGWPIG
jgi:hypothetical protein